MSTAKNKRWGLVASLAWSDLKFEKILTICIVLALMAIIAPLFLLLGLKNGVVENQLKRLIEDPVYRELRPERNEQLSGAWFKTVRDREDVAFLVPSVLRGASSVAVRDRRGSDLIVDLIPTAPGDALLLSNEAQVPGAGEVVLSQSAADRIGPDPAHRVKVGDMVELVVSRGGRRPIEISLQVSDILPPRADSLARLYAPFALVEDIETYRSGAPVPTRGWAGKVPVPYASIDAMMVLGADALARRERLLLRRNTGVKKVADLPYADAVARLGVASAQERTSALLSGSGALFLPAQLNAVRNVIRGHDVALIPLFEPIEAGLVSGSGARLEAPLRGLGWSARVAAQFGLPPLPFTADLTGRDDFAAIAQILVPEGSGFDPGSTATLTAHLPSGPIIFDVTIAGLAPGSDLVVPPALAAMLRTGTQVPIAYDPDLGTLVQHKGGYRGFRLYARSIYDVAGLEAMLLEEGIETVTRRDDIDRVQELESVLNRLFFFVAIIGVTGAIFAIAASLYASVERKHASIGVMRLIGIPRRLIMLFPLTQAGMIGFASAVLAMLVYYFSAWRVNVNFADKLPFGEDLVVLPLWHILIALVLTPLICVVAAVFAAVRATRIDPAEAIRQE